MSTRQLGWRPTTTALMELGAWGWRGCHSAYEAKAAAVSRMLCVPLTGNEDRLPPHVYSADPACIGSSPARRGSRAIATEPAASASPGHPIDPYNDNSIRKTNSAT